MTNPKKIESPNHAARNVQKGVDFATGKPIDGSKPEERVRQEFEKILHEDFSYPRECMDIEVPIAMGRSRKLCDIAIYDSPKKQRIIGIIETKSPKEHFEEGQLESYMNATATCQWGVWTNLEEIRCFRREGNDIFFDPAFSIPRHGESGVRIRSYRDLVPASNLKWIFRQINNRLYANANLSRTEKQGAEMVRLIFCKLADEYAARRKSNITPLFQVESGEAGEKTREKIDKLWSKVRSGKTGASIFDENERIEIDDHSLQIIVAALQSYALLDTKRDVVGDAFEIFAERQFAGAKGQFFTPRPVVSMLIEMVAPEENETIIDPACGSGGFLIAALNHIAEGWDEEEKRNIAEHSLYGIDKEKDLAKICRAQMSIIGDGKSNICTDDSLFMDGWSDNTKAKLLKKRKLRQFDVVLTNPPFGSTIKIDRKEVLKEYDLGHKWRRKPNAEKEEVVWEKTSQTKETPPQVLFIELCMRLLKPGGRMGIVLPDGLLGNPGDGYIRQWIESHAEVMAVVDCPTATFMPHTGTKTSVLVLRKKQEAEQVARAHAPFMAVAENCGHTTRGAEIISPDGTMREDFTAISQNFLNDATGSYLGFKPRKMKDRIFVPRYYDPRILQDIVAMEKNGGNLEMVSVEELSDRGALTVTGVSASARSEEYDLHGSIRFVRTSDIAGFEVYERTQKNVSEETYGKYSERQDFQVGDILFVKDGDDKIGETAILLDNQDCRILVQTHFKKLRVNPEKLNPFLLLYLLNTPIVRRQIRQRVFNQSTLSTIGDRIMELRLPIPKNAAKKRKIAEKMEELVVGRRKNLQLMRELFRG